MGGPPHKMNSTTLIMAMAAMADSNTRTCEIARRLGMTAAGMSMSLIVTAAAGARIIAEAPATTGR